VFQTETRVVADESGWRRYSSILGRRSGDANRETIEMHLEVVIEGVYRCTWRPPLSKFGDGLEGHDRVNSEMDMDPVIELV